MLSAEEIEQYNEEGFLIKAGLLSSQELEFFRNQAREDLERGKSDDRVMEKADKDGNVTLLKMWHTAEDDVYGYVARDERLVTMATEILEKPVYLYSHKMTMKDPGSGGAWEWHQDFGYWYNNGCLAPEMLSIWIALDLSTKENGCLQVLPRTHKLGRIDHVRENDQTVVDGEYLQAAVDRHKLQYVEMNPGDALVFHCNLLHRSDANTSQGPRWGYICSYNTVENAPFKKVRDYGNFQELHVVPAGHFME